MIVLNPENYKLPEFITPETFHELPWIQQDYILLLYSKKHTRKEIQRLLYMPSRSSYYRLRKKVTRLIQEEMARKDVSI